MPIPRKTRHINRSFVRDEVYRTLLKWIMEGVLSPGEKLLDKELAAKLGVSRTPVREALRRLEDKALVESAANRWTRVADITTDEAAFIYPVIWTLEALAASLAVANLAANDFDRLEQENRNLRTALETGDALAASAADAAFHDVYIRKSANQFLIDILEDLKVQHRRMEVLYFEGCACASDSLDEHLRIVEHLRARDADGAMRAIRSNWERSLARLRTGVCAPAAGAAGDPTLAGLN